MITRPDAVSHSRAEFSSVTLVGLPHYPRHLQPLPAAAPVREGTKLHLLQRSEIVLGWGWEGEAGTHLVVDHIILTVTHPL